MSKLVALIAITTALGGCATTVTTYVPSEGQSVTYNQGVGTITAQTADATLLMYPTFRYQTPSEIPTFTLMVQNTTIHDIDFNPETLTASVDSQQCHVYSLEERVSEIRKAARRKQVALAIAGGLAAAGAGYAAAHQTATYSSVSYVGNRSFYTTGTVRVYDPASGIFAGAAVGAVTGVGIHQIAKAAGYEEQAAQGIFQRTTIHPGSTAIGQIELKTSSDRFAAVNVNVPVDGAVGQLQFLKKNTP
jgi:uncharacterized protein YceK